MTVFAAPGALWTWRDNPPFASGYGFYDAGQHQFCWFRKQIYVDGATRDTGSSWGRIKTLFR